MIAGAHCGCAVCRMERYLTHELGEDRSWTHQLVADSTHVFSAFGRPLEVVEALHSPSHPSDPSYADRMLVAILKENAQSQPGLLWQTLLLLVFVPTIHATASHIATAFPALSREDISQQVISVFLECLASGAFLGCRSHLAYVVSRKIRRLAFRWAIREARLAAPQEIEERSAEMMDDRELLEARVVLDRFLDSCQKAGWLLGPERDLLIEFKLKAVSSKELASRNGHSAVAIQHKIQRVMEKLRRVAKKNPPRQLELFVAGTSRKIFR
jgi:hypothetical protein